MNDIFSEERDFKFPKDAWNKELFKTIRVEYKRLITDMSLSLQNDYDVPVEPRMLEILLAYPGIGYLGNGYDAIVERYKARSQARVDGALEFALTANEDEIRFEVNDNGTGVNPRIVSSLFFKKQSRRKWNDSRLVGGLGSHLYRIKGRLDCVGGSYGFQNHGKNQGARFWLMIPLDSLENYVDVASRIG